MHFPLSLACLLIAQPAAEITFREKDKGQLEVVAPLTTPQQKAVPPGKLTADQGAAWLRLSLIDPDTKKAGPTMLGDYQREGDSLLFRPRFGVESGRTYRATFGPIDGQTITKDYKVALRNGGALTTVVKIYPTADVLPANVLRFTIHFSQPMRGGKDIFKQIEILDAEGNVVSDSWLMDEMWDESGQILILYIHPGRIKWGVILREVFGPVLYPDRNYTLVVRGAMVDGNDQKLGKDYTKKFRTTTEDRVRIHLADWKLQAPAAGSSAALNLSFPKSLDHNSLKNLLTVKDAKGNAITGKINLAKDEKSWSFTPANPWGNQEYRLVVDSKFEDVAGNTPQRPFDLDLKAPALPPQRLEIPFQPTK
jgi:hypothetical protein